MGEVDLGSVVVAFLDQVDETEPEAVAGAIPSSTPPSAPGRTGG
ncbi:hypothetical protein [Actinomadura sp. NAK00032]|nr:hypothetical protein [Actinomadura sp. NAK00032]